MDKFDTVNDYITNNIISKRRELEIKGDGILSRFKERYSELLDITFEPVPAVALNEFEKLSRHEKFSIYENSISLNINIGDFMPNQMFKLTKSAIYDRKPERVRTSSGMINLSTVIADMLEERVKRLYMTLGCHNAVIDSTQTRIFITVIFSIKDA